MSPDRITGTIAVVLLCMFGQLQPLAAQDKGGGTSSQSQHQIDLAAVRADRKAVVGQEMHLTSEEAKAFWPLYADYEGKMDKIDDRHYAEVKSYAEHYQTLTDADATHKLDEVMAIRQARLDVQKEYIPKFRAVISSIKTTRFFQIDNKLEAMTQCQIARLVPLATRGGRSE